MYGCRISRKMFTCAAHPPHVPRAQHSESSSPSSPPRQLTASHAHPCFHSSWPCTRESAASASDALHVHLAQPLPHETPAKLTRPSLLRFTLETVPNEPCPMTPSTSYCPRALLPIPLSAAMAAAATSKLKTGPPAAHKPKLCANQAQDEADSLRRSKLQSQGSLLVDLLA